MNHLKIIVAGYPEDVERAVRNLRDVLDVQTEITVSGDEGRVIQKTLIVCARTSRTNQIEVIVSPVPSTPPEEEYSETAA